MMNIKLLEIETQMIHFIMYKIFLLSFNSTYRMSVHIIASTEGLLCIITYRFQYYYHGIY